MKRDDILNMQAGREMDALVAENVMKHSVRRGVVNWSIKTSETISEGFTTLAHYSTDISAAWEVVEKLGIAIIPQSAEGGFRWLACDLDKVVYTGEITIVEKNESSNSAKSAPLAICRAALLSVMGD